MTDFDDDDLEFLAAQARAEHVADDLQDELERLKAVNADLLEALKAITDAFWLSCEDLTEEFSARPEVIKASAAIAKAKGEQE